jgi:alginate O-acetyltransferase complex protein AlgI
MTFVSVDFLIFFPVVVVLFFVAPFRFRWVVLLAASYIFYMAWNPVYVLLIIGTTIVTWASALATLTWRSRYLAFLIGLTANLGGLVFFKYFAFLNDQIIALASLIGLQYPVRPFQILLPIAISFHSFQMIAYMVDVYRRRIDPETDIRTFLLYGCFFPQLVAGPIERGEHFLPQLRRLFDPTEARFFQFNYDRASDGLRLMLIGFFKKIVVADNFGPFVDAAFAHHGSYSPASVAVAVLAFSLQIYFDFSAYTDIARGAAHVLGFHLVENFNRPYFAGSISEFWRRWHMSLTGWFRDYVYIPLGGNRVSASRWAANILITFLLSGLWHGANWTFAVWGLLHGAFYLGEQAIRRIGLRAWSHPESVTASLFWRTVQSAVVLFCVGFAWIFFRAPTITDAFAILSHLKEGVLGRTAADLQTFSWSTNIGQGLATALFFSAVVLIAEAMASREIRLKKLPVLLRWGIYYGMLASMMLVGQVGNSPFIYFQF